MTAQARLLWAEGRLAEAGEAIQRARAQFEHRRDIPDYLQSRAMLVQIDLWIAGGALEPARQWLFQRGRHPEEAPAFNNELELATLARLLAAEGELERAAAIYQRLVECLRQSDRAGRLLGCLAAWASILGRAGERESAQRALTEALHLAQARGYVQSVIDQGPGLGPILQQLLVGKPAAEAVAPAFLEVILRGVVAAGEPTGRGAPTGSDQTLLSEREMEVLGLLARGLANKEMAAELHLSVSTIKTHVSRIYKKLGVGTRTQAANRARRLGLLPAG